MSGTKRAVKAMLREKVTDMMKESDTKRKGVTPSQAAREDQLHRRCMRLYLDSYKSRPGGMADAGSHWRNGDEGFRVWNKKFQDKVYERFGSEIRLIEQQQSKGAISAR
jgi:hypothetical protein